MPDISGAPGLLRFRYQIGGKDLPGHVFRSAERRAEFLLAPSLGFPDTEMLGIIRQDFVEVLLAHVPGEPVP